MRSFPTFMLRTRRTVLVAALLCTATFIGGCDSASTPSPSVDSSAHPELMSPTGGTLAETKSAAGFRLVWDRFEDGFSTGTDGKWSYFAFGPYIGDDGLETTTPSGLRVVSSGTHPGTGAPAFTRTLGQEGAPDNPFPLPGGLDHVKWLTFMNHVASSGVPGFDAIEGQELRCEATMSARTYGTSGHPFGDAVSNALDDTRLAAVAMNAIDLQTLMVFDFFLSNEQIYALYERLPFAQGPGNDYASFTFLIPVGKRTPDDDHNLKIGYDKAAGTVRWLLDEKEVFRVDQIGHLIDRKYMVLDHGGTEEDVSPNQLNCGMGMFTLLDAHGPNGEGLVRLSTAPDFYFSPPLGAPTPETFVDEDSQPGSRLFGQGAELRMRQYVVSSRPSRASLPMP